MCFYIECWLRYSNVEAITFAFISQVAYSMYYLFHVCILTWRHQIFKHVLLFWQIAKSCISTMVKCNLELTSLFLPCFFQTFTFLALVFSLWTSPCHVEVPSWDNRHQNNCQGVPTIDALPSPGVNPLEGSPKCSCGKLGFGRRSRLPTLERGRGSSWEPMD